MNNISSGPLLQVDKNIFLINTNNGEMPFRLINNKLYFKDNSVYEKNEDRYQAYLINEKEKYKIEWEKQEAKKAKQEEVIEQRRKYIKELERRGVDLPYNE